MTVRGIVALALLLSACSGASGSGAPSTPEATGGRVGAVTAVVDDVVVPAHTGLAETTATLADAVDALCATPSAAQLAAAREAWRAAATARATERPVAVGPAMDRSSKAELDWQADPERIDEVLAGDEPITPETVATGASGARGLLAAEHLLFGSGADALAEGEARRCDYAAAVAALAAGEAQRLVDEFADGAAETLAGRGGVAMTTEGAIDELVNTQVNALDDLVDGRLAPDAAGEPSGSPAGHESALAEATLATVAQLYAPERLGGPLPDGTRQAVRSTFDDALAALDAGGSELPSSGAAARGEIHAAADEARVVVRTDVVSALDVVLSFSDNDGDSG